MRKELVTIGIVMLLIPLISVVTANQDENDYLGGNVAIVVDIDVRPHNGDLPNRITIGGVSDQSKVPILVSRENINVDNINLTTLEINGVSVSLTGIVEEYDGVLFKFNEKDLTTGDNPAIILEDTELKLSGELTTGKKFYGIDSIYVELAT